MNELELSVVIATHNNLPILKQCLASWELVHDVNYELIVIEDGCSDGTAEWLTDVADGERVRWFHEDDVFETLCDIRGMHEARGQYILIWQDDMFVQQEWFIVEALATLEAWPELGVLGLMRGNCFRPLEFEPKCRAEFYDPVHKRDTTRGGFFRAHEVDACVRPWIVRKACTEKHGVLDEAFAPQDWDEVDYHFRLRAVGWKVAVLPYEELGGYIHLGRTTVSKLDSDWHDEFFTKNGLLFYDRWADFIQQNQHRKRKTWRRIPSRTIPPGLFNYLKLVWRKKVVRPPWLIWRRLKQKLAPSLS